MKSFLLKCLLFSLPIIGIFIFPFSVFFLSGEFLPVKSIVNRQISSSEEVLYQSAFTGDTDMPYKVLMTEKRNPEVVVLGRSRTLPFRADFFKNPSTFYNAGRAVHDSNGLSNYINQIPNDSKLKIIMFDMSNFLEDYKYADVIDRSSFFDILSLFFTSSWREVYISYLNHKFSFIDLLKQSLNNDRYIGLASIFKHAGFRPDGSYNHGDYSNVLVELKNVPSQIKKSIEDTTVENEPKVSEDSIKQIENFLSICQKRNIYVIGYLSPYSSELFNKEQSLNDDNGIYKTEPKILSSLMSKFKYPFYDLRDNRLVGSSDSELYDPGHSTEKGTLRLLSYLASREKRLGEYVDFFSIKSKIAKEQF